ncbi:MAG TPA: RnfABCDGE type electron transport complex subunit B [Oscillospiraceae bacterium]|nr:RnfABCDGE type electron transport complex subunit B [Oscillospiraceae bacterium]
MILPAVVSLGGLGLIFGSMLAFASQKFAIEIDPKIEQVLEVLAGANCGACGCAGCAQFAEEVVAGRASITGCTPGGSKVAACIAEILGAEAPEAQERCVALLKCQGDCNTVKAKHLYHGIADCKAAIALNGGPSACSYGCVGLGNCVKVCPVDAITMGENGLPLIDVELCISCGNCVAECPRHVIEMVSTAAQPHVLCKSRDKGKYVRSVCERGCIACGLCVKKCPENAIYMENNVAVIDSSLCNNCGICVEVCPEHTIV